MENKIINSRVINEVQNYIRTMNWAQKEYRGELLINYLNGVRDALFEKGLIFSLCSKTASYNVRTTIYFILVEQYEDYTDCWSEKKTVMEIYDDWVKQY